LIKIWQSTHLLRCIRTPQFGINGVYSLCTVNGEKDDLHYISFYGTSFEFFSEKSSRAATAKIAGFYPCYTGLRPLKFGTRSFTITAGADSDRDPLFQTLTFNTVHIYEGRSTKFGVCYYGVPVWLPRRNYL
jgi:hypothetical protein